MMERIPFDALRELAVAALTVHGASPGVSAEVARALVTAEAEGNTVCGLVYLPIFCAHLDSGKMDGRAEPQVLERAPGAIEVDACHGFAHPAFAAGLPKLIVAARANGIAAMSVAHSYNALALSDPVVTLVEAGLIGLACSNAPASVACPGSKRPMFGTNPLAFGVPSADGEHIVFDQSSSAVSRTAVRMRAEKGESIPLGWAQDREGKPTTDAKQGYEGALLPSGGQKGANVAFMVEMLAAGLSGSSPSTRAGSLAIPDGPRPDLGQLVLAIDPGHFAGSAVASLAASLATGLRQDGLRPPGARRRESLTRSHTEGIPVSAPTLERVRLLARRPESSV